MDDKARQGANIASGAHGDWLVTKLPSCLIMDILSRVPILTLIHCRAVCKTWLHLISHPSFAKLQLQSQSSPPDFLVETEHLLSESKQLELVRLTGNNTQTSVGVEKLEFFSTKNKRPNDLSLINSCNGLLCLSLGHIHVCNPVLGEFITIPLTKYWETWNTYGFGFCASTNEYKLLQTVYLKKGGEGYKRAAIYTIGKGKWRSLGIPPCMISYDLPIHATLNGCIHWFGLYKIDSIFSFDFSSEQFKVMNLPLCLDVEKTSCMTLGVLKGCLCVCVASFDEQFHLWTMKNYGDEESWTEILVTEKLTNRSLYIDCQLVAELDNEEILVLCVDRLLVYDTKTKKSHDPHITKKKERIIRIFPHTTSFVSLKDIAEEDEVVITRCRRQLESSYCSKMASLFDAMERRSNELIPGLSDTVAI